MDQLIEGVNRYVAYRSQELFSVGGVPRGITDEVTSTIWRRIDELQPHATRRFLAAAYAVREAKWTS